MRRTRLISLFAMPLALGLAACTSDDGVDAGPDAGVDSGVPFDTGIIEQPDAGEPPDTGPLPCIWDQGGEENRGCEPGFVCNLAMDPPSCVPGTACTTDTDCDSCSALQNPTECGHGFHVTAFCDPNHGNVCTRSRAPCEPCEDSAQCGRQDPAIGGEANTCVDYGGGESYCGRPCTLGCPQGFQCDGNVCVRNAGCADEPVICPEGTPGQPCAGTDQICAGVECPDTGGAKCSNNDLPGNIGICIGFCTSDDDCPAALPVCNTRNGICISGCTKDSCPAGQVCHLDGFCASPCENNDDCTMNDAYGENSYCNIPGVPPPRYFKGYRDPNSCAPLGCERPVDCAAAEVVCDKTLTIPECVQGCFQTEDCRSGNVCKRGDATQSYTREQCRALPNIPDGNETEIGTCCYPGCLDRVLQCGIGDFCCGEPDSPYEDPASCLTLTSTGTIQAEPGLCFDHGGPAPWCVQCDEETVCDSGWTPGFNVDPNINGGQPFKEQEFCFNVAIGMAQVPLCSITCNPTADDSGCPGRWPCGSIQYQCLQDADCGPGLECINEDTSDPMMPIPGQCKCGENGVEQIACPADGGGFTGVERPRCVPFAEDMVCIAGYRCQQPSDPTGYSAVCGF